MNRFFLPAATLLGWPTRRKFQAIKKAGFDGVEIVVGPKTDLNRKREEAKKWGLEIHWHQPWSLEENPTHLHNHALAWLGILPRGSYRLAEIHRGAPEPLVAYADRWKEAPPFVTTGNVWLQTCSTFGKDGKHRLTYDQFLAVERLYKNPIVFDTQHYLELCLEVKGVEDLPTDPWDLSLLLLRGWDKLGSYVREIHLSDFDPRWGHTLGRNVFLGKGVIPLEDFAGMVRRSSWEGVVTPEVSPLWLLPRPTHRLRDLNKIVRQLFGGT